MVHLININHLLCNLVLIHVVNDWNQVFIVRNFHDFYRIHRSFLFTVLDNFFHTFFFHNFSNDFDTDLVDFFVYCLNFNEYFDFRFSFVSFD